MEKCCDICGDIGVGEAIISCSQCQSNSEHMYCMRIILKKHIDDWLCEDCQSSSEQSEEQTSGQNERKRKGRGRTTMSDLVAKRGKGEKIYVSFNERGQPVGDGRVKMESTIGALVRSLVPISIRTWKGVPTEHKKRIWDSLIVNFDLPSSAKKLVLQSAGMKWRYFKAKLYSKYIAPFDDFSKYAHPPPLYNDIIHQNDWDKFVHQRSAPEFKKTSELQKLRRSKNIYKHRISRKGYANLEHELLSKSDRGTEVTRAMVWKLAHASKSGEYIDEATCSMAKKIDECASSMAIEGIESDVLGLALGKPEHSGRVRGVGCYVSVTQYFHTSRSSSISRLKHTHEEALKAQQEFFEQKLAEERQKHEAEFSDMKNRLALLEQKFMLMTEGPTQTHTHLVSEKANCSIAEEEANKEWKYLLWGVFHRLKRDPKSMSGLKLSGQSSDSANYGHNQGVMRKIEVSIPNGSLKEGIQPYRDEPAL